MTGAINNLAASAAGAPLTSAQGVREKREAERKETDRRRGIRDEYQQQVSQTESADAVRTTEDSTQEQTREDHEEHASGYVRRDADNERPSIDLSA